MCRCVHSWCMAAVLVAACASGLSAQDLALGDLIAAALKDSPVIRAAEAKAAVATQKVPMQGSLMDPMFSIGYQNEGIRDYTYGDSPDAQWMFSLEQTLPWPGKLALQEEAAALDARAEAATVEMARREVAASVTQAFYDFLLADRELEFIRSLRNLTTQLEDVGLARYGSGTGSQEDVLMAQAERYMLLEREAMAGARRSSAEAMLRAETGSLDLAPLGRPLAPPTTPFDHTAEELVMQAEGHAPELAMHRASVLAAEKRFARSRKEVMPDVTFMARYSSRGGGMEDMYELTASVPLPLYYRSRQGAGIEEATRDLVRARSEFEAARVRIAGRIRDDLAMVHAAGRIVETYRVGLIPNARKGIDAALASYAAGRIEASAALARLKAPFDYEIAVLQQQVQREKAIARITFYTGAMEAPLP